MLKPFIINKSTSNFRLDRSGFPYEARHVEADRADVAEGAAHRVRVDAADVEHW